MYWQKKLQKKSKFFQLFVFENDDMENQLVFLECEIKKISEKKKSLKEGFLRFHPFCIHYSKVN